MQEDFLHFIWQYQKFKTVNLTTVCGKSIQVIAVGTHNFNSGPDFFNSKVRIGNQLWVGNVELHINASDWYMHKHEQDAAYSNVILHVVWKADTKVYDRHQNEIATLELQHVVNALLLQRYKKLLAKKNWINCENQIHTITPFTMSFWKEKLLVRRLQRKYEGLEVLLDASKNNWEAVLFIVLAENFGLKINASQFRLLAKNISFKVFKKQGDNCRNLEALLFGQANLLNDVSGDKYFLELKRTYAYLKHKYQLEDSLVAMHFFRLRPPSFPTIRLSQFATLYGSNQNLFSKIIAASTISDLYELFIVGASEYWDTHYTFRKRSSKRKKVLTKSFINLLLINAIIPLKYAYAKSRGNANFETVTTLYDAIKAEKNTVVNKFVNLKVPVKTAADSQALIELKTQYCDRYKCLYCEIGNKLLNPL